MLAVLGGEHQDRRPVVLLAKRRAHRVAVQLGQHDVEDDGVEGLVLRHPQPLLAVAGDLDAVPVGDEALP